MVEGEVLGGRHVTPSVTKSHCPLESVEFTIPLYVTQLSQVFRPSHAKMLLNPPPILYTVPFGCPRETSGRPLKETALLLLKKIGTQIALNYQNLILTKYSENLACARPAEGAMVTGLKPQKVLERTSLAVHS